MTPSHLTPDSPLHMHCCACVISSYHCMLSPKLAPFFELPNNFPGVAVMLVLCACCCSAVGGLLRDVCAGLPNNKNKTTKTRAITLCIPCPYLSRHLECPAAGLQRHLPQGNCLLHPVPPLQGSSRMFLPAHAPQLATTSSGLSGYSHTNMRTLKNSSFPRRRFLNISVPELYWLCTPPLNAIWALQLHLSIDMLLACHCTHAHAHQPADCWMQLLCLAVRVAQRS